jgi:predicted DNA-binding transcriptional regulator AlpA
MQYLPGRQVRDRYNVSDMTIWRWLQNAELKFPKPTVINRRRYWLLEELEQWERERAARTSGAAA